ncbi:MAG: helix-turn-helix domain-containing protein [Pyrinomonadaceae bacterium]|nr:helix-turn-helix domain-containing protein [Pyrinomonadaceae bacterium]
MKKQKTVAVELPPKDELMTATEAAEFLRVHRSCITRWIQQDKLRGYKLGTRLLIRRSSVAILLAENEV